VTLVITRFPVTDVDDPAVFRVTEGIWHDAGQLSNFVHSVNDATVIALLAPEHVRCSWFSFPDLEARQAVGVAKLRATEQSLGLVHSSAGLDFDGAIATATIAPEVMQSGLNSLAARDLNPDIVLPLALVFNAPSEGISKAEFDGVAVLRGPRFAIPDEAVLRDIFVGASPADNVDAESLRSMLLSASVAPVLNLREGIFAKRERTVWTSAEQRSWIKRLLGVIVLITIFITLATLAKYWSATRAENETALAAAQKIDPTIRDIDQAESALASSLDRRGIVHSGFTPLSAALWRSVKASPNVSVRELRFTRDGILTAVLAAPTADNLNKTLVTIQQDGFRITATPRQDASGSTLVDLTVRMP
jgi:general secretion pathway protein L